MDRMDFAQADRMLELLRTPTLATLDAVMAAKGTELIVKQQNLSRRVTVEQYRTILAAIAADSAPMLAPADDGERAKRGVVGLREEVWVALHWGAANTDVLATRVAEIRKLDAGNAAAKLAAAWLPEPTAPTVQLHVVIGGRAGAAAIDHDIYFDVLSTSFRASIGRGTYPSPSEIVEFFAHETHHVGLAPYIDKRRPSLSLDAERRAYDLLASLVTEGGATYFINAHRHLDRMRKDPQYADHLTDPKLLTTIERLLDDVLAQGLAGEAYEKAITPLVAAGFHSAGALMMDAIYRHAGRDGVLAVMRDPRKLLVEYNAAKGESPFDRALSERVAQLGDHPER